MKGRTGYVVRRSGRQCLMAILIILGLTSKNQVNNVSYPLTCFILTFLTPSSFFLIAATAHPHISDEQLGFIQRILEIPLDQRKCRDLINLDTLHLYCGGLDPLPEARKLGEYSRRRKWIFYIISSIDVLFFLTFVGLFCRDGHCKAKD